MVEQGVPTIFRSGAGNLVNYNYTDILQGVGYITLYGAIDQSSSGILTPHSLASDQVASTTSVISGAYALAIDKTFDMTVNTPLSVKGITNIVVPLDLSVAGTSKSARAYIDATLSKVTNGVATTIKNISGAELVDTTDGAGTETYSHEKLMLLRFDTPQTNYGRGDTIRLNTKVYAKYLAAPITATVSLGHDPQDRSSTISGCIFGTGESTQMILSLPVRIDL